MTALLFVYYKTETLFKTFYFGNQNFSLSLSFSPFLFRFYHSHAYLSGRGVKKQLESNSVFMCGQKERTKKIK